MSRRYLRKKYNKYTSEPEPQRELGRLVIQATSPEDSAPHQKLLVEIANGVSTRKTADTDSAVKALSSRLSDSDSRIVINALSVADYLLRNVTEPKVTATNVRSIFESTLLPKIRRLARGLATAPGEPVPNPKLRETALRHLQEWASSRFLSGALTKHPMFAEAYREATRTPSPPTSAAADVAASKAPPAPTSSVDELVSAPNGSLGPSTPDQKPSDFPSLKRRESSESGPTRMHSKLGSPPTDDGQFVTYFNKMISTFDKLHRVQHLSLEDEGLRKLRSSMEQNLERLSRVSTNFGQPHQKKAEMAWNFARDRLGKFSDRQPSNASESSSTISGSQPAPPPYPPPLVKRNTATRLPYGRETSDVHSWNPSIVSSGPSPSANFSEEPTSSNGSHLPSLPEPSIERKSSIACPTRAQQRMMRIVNSTYSLSPTTVAWTDAPFATLPNDLFLGAAVDSQHPSMAQQPCSQGHQGPPPRAGTQPYVQHGAGSFGPPLLQQQQQMMGAHQMYYSHVHNPFPPVPGAAPPGMAQPHLPTHTQMRPHDSGNGLGNAPNSYHHFANYPRAA